MKYYHHKISKVIVSYTLIHVWYRIWMCIEGCPLSAWSSFPQCRGLNGHIFHRQIWSLIFCMKGITCEFRSFLGILYYGILLHMPVLYLMRCYSLTGNYPWSWTWCPVSSGSFSWPLPLQDTQRAVHCTWRHVHRPVCVLWKERWILNESYRVPY